MKEKFTCEVCLQETEYQEGDVTYDCEICGRIGFCEDCAKPENHDCILVETSFMGDRG